MLTALLGSTSSSESKLWWTTLQKWSGSKLLTESVPQQLPKPPKKLQQNALRDRRPSHQ
ncbi:hypothetical protein F444_18538 [Phytophthora nicotianae P1976]|uniref:Uncharacterized protein n=1 Tax=Phytophthora nicotianae P1976 TaxID=1317066 RepID=A0A080ZB17_PHYNI|nr:hypothetical protein F444_18538 [Phytophthora nicotianae P1976]